VNDLPVQRSFIKEQKTEERSEKIVKKSQPHSSSHSAKAVTFSEKVVKESQPDPIITEPEVKETPISKAVEPPIISELQDASLTKPADPTVITAVKEVPKPSDPKPLLDIEFGTSNGPKFLQREMPVYPPLARRLGKEGMVVLRLTIDEKGKLLNIEIVEGAGYGFTEAAIDAVKRSTFIPAKLDGKPVMSKALLQIRFHLRRE
ncbi:MAG: TonB family protein, partial [Thermodesulfobacteriaceae bacterium]|nr:TonB family protein [Thermodesulfobacteriaceae bacterium]